MLPITGVNQIKKITCTLSGDWAICERRFAFS